MYLSVQDSHYRKKKNNNNKIIHFEVIFQKNFGVLKDTEI